MTNSEIKKSPEDQLTEAQNAIGIKQQELAMEGISGPRVDALRELSKGLESGTILPEEVGKILGVNTGSIEVAVAPEKNADEKEEAKQAIGLARYIMAMEGISGPALDELQELAKGLEDGSVSPGEVKIRLGEGALEAKNKLEKKTNTRAEPAAEDVEKLLCDIMYRMVSKGTEEKDVDAVLDIFKELKKGTILPRVAKSRASEFGE